LIRQSRAHQYSAGAKKKEMKQLIEERGLSTKIHAKCDAIGNPTAFHLTAGQGHDLEGADEFLKEINFNFLLADKSYDAKERVLTRILDKLNSMLSCQRKLASRNSAGFLDKFCWFVIVHDLTS
jgi:hypothetical protein